MLKIAVVKKKSDGWYVESKKGKNLGGPYDSEGAANKRLQQVEYFKRKGALARTAIKEVLADIDDYLDSAGSEEEFSAVLELMIGDRIWTRDEWDAYQKLHPYTTLKPKFRDSSTGEEDMNEQSIAKRVTAFVMLAAKSGDAAAYRKYFETKLKKWKVDSPSAIPEDKKDDFFEEVDKGWDADNESD